MTTAESSRPWVLAGGLTFACVGVVGLAYELGIGRIQFTEQMLKTGAFFTVLNLLFGLLVGFVFAKIRGVIGLLGIYSQGIVAMVFLNTVLTLFWEGLVGLNTADFALSSARSVGSGLLFAYFGLRFGAQK